MQETLQFIENHINTISLIVTGLFLLSEALAEIPSIKANNVFRLIFNILTNLKNLLSSSKVKLLIKAAPTAVVPPVDKPIVTSEELIKTIDKSIK